MLFHRTPDDSIKIPNYTRTPISVIKIHVNLTTKINPSLTQATHTHTHRHTYHWPGIPVIEARPSTPRKTAKWFRSIGKSSGKESHPSTSALALGCAIRMRDSSITAEPKRRIYATVASARSITHSGKTGIYTFCRSRRRAQSSLRVLIGRGFCTRHYSLYRRALIYSYWIKSTAAQLGEYISTISSLDARALLRFMRS